VDVIFISGFLSHLEQAWEPGGPGPFFAALASRARLILFDRRGVGLSDRLSQRSTLDDNVDDVLAVLDAAGSRQAVVFAISEGGPIGIRLAARHPERVRSLALWGTLAKGTADERHPWALTPAQYQRWLEGLVAQWGQPTGIEAFAPGHERNPLLRRWWARTLRLGGSPGSLRALLGTLAQVDVRAELANVHVPTLVMHRSEDRAVRVEAGRHVAQGIAGARFLELPGNEHWFWLGDTTLALQALTELLR
jgi:pimeloyl-ACP methyl ester carboxylesterase